MKPHGKYLVLVILVILLILVALVLATRAAAPVVALAVGGARRLGGAPREAAPASVPAYTHPLGKALNEYARTLGPEHAVGLHPLDRERYEPLGAASASGGAAAKKANPKKAATAKRPWTEYETWEDLSKDEGATAQYFEQRAAVLNNPALNWSSVWQAMAPKLLESREYIGLANVDPDGKTVRLVAHEASPIEAGTMDSDTAFAAVPSELVVKYARRPAMIIFHTHPADPRGSPLPSSHDLSTGIYFAAHARFAAHAVLSRYGVLLFGLGWRGYQAVNEAKDPRLATLNLSHDVVAAHEAVRSWSEYTLTDYLEFYPRHRLRMDVYPSPEMTGDSRNYSWVHSLEGPIDHEVIIEHANDVKEHLDKKKKETRRRAKQAKQAQAQKTADLGLD